MRASKALVPNSAAGHHTAAARAFDALGEWFARATPGYERLLDGLDDLDVAVPVLVTRFADMPEPYRTVGSAEAVALARRIEAAARKAT